MLTVNNMHVGFEYQHSLQLKQVTFEILKNKFENC